MASTRLVFACDVSEPGLGRHLINLAAPEIDVVKTGLEAMTAEDDMGETLARGFRIRAQELGKGCMWDMKLLDIGNTMAAAVRNIVRHGSTLFTLHAMASNDALQAVVQATAGTKSLPLAVTVLTDLDDPQCISRFGVDSNTSVLHFAKIAYDCGIRGFVCSAKEARAIRDKFPDVVIVTPAIRPLWAVGKDEQKRVTTPTEAAQAGADYIVVGRPISNPPLSMNHRQAAREIREELLAA
ncbi:MAG TPA: orotidine-5'-phosphate decarboxylase [Candidatus Paceibacterota bacterium]|nr:orotidine-5'-phosphate decarboxylase [Candidatus Paceibacterota bacterium]